MKRSLPPEDFYSGLSLYYDLGYGPEGEYNLLKNYLKSEGFPIDDVTVNQALLLSKNMYRLLNNYCQKQIQDYDNYLKKEFVVGADIVTPVWLSHFLVKLVLIAAKIGKKFSNAFTFKSHEDKLLEGIIKKLENSGEGEFIAKKTTEFRIKYNKIKDTNKHINKPRHKKITRPSVDSRKKGPS